MVEPILDIVLNKINAPLLSLVNHMLSLSATNPDSIKAVGDDLILMFVTVTTDPDILKLIIQKIAPQLLNDSAKLILKFLDVTNKAVNFVNFFTSYYLFATEIAAYDAQIDHHAYLQGSQNAVSASINADNTTGVAPLTVSFTATVSGGDTSCAASYSYSWNFADGNTSTLSNPSHTFSAVASYEVSLTVTDCAGTKATATKVISVSSATNQSPTATLSADKTSGTAPLTVTFTIGYTDPEGAAGTYSLDYGDSTGAVTGQLNSSASTTVQHTYSSTSTFTATLTVTDDKGATGTGSVSLSISSSSGGTKTVKQVSGGDSHTCALLSDGSVKCWGTGYQDSPTVVLGLTDVISISSGGHSIEEHTCVIVSSGGVKCMGDNLRGALGNGTNIDSSVPVDVSGLTSGVVSISAGGYHSCALTSSGSVKCWGWNYSGQLGNGTTTNSNVPVSVSGINNATSISAGGNHTCALLSDGTTRCWGENESGQLGNGTKTDSPIPVDVSGLASGVVSVSAGVNQTCAITTTGGVKCWGVVPEDVSGLTSGIVGVSVGFSHACAISSLGGLKCWGSNSDGQLGDGTSSSGYSTIPVDVYGITSGSVSVSTGRDHTCTVLSDGSVKCWGSNSSGQLGIGDFTGPQQCKHPGDTYYACSTRPISVSSTLYALSPWTQFKNLVLSFADTIKRTLDGALWD